MIIIGEKINGTRARVAAALAQRDVAYIQGLAKLQAEAGADYLDVNAGSSPDKEPEDLAWLVETVQASVNVPLCLDSSNPVALEQGLERVKQTPIINSISGEDNRLKNIIPLAKRHDCKVIALVLDERGIPTGVEGRLITARRIMEHIRQNGLKDEDIFLDPLVLSVATDNSSALTVLDSVRTMRIEFPAVRFIIGLSNISFGLPARSFINRVFLVMALEAGINAAIIDPLDQEISGTMLAAELLLNRDRFCQNYTRAYRAARFRVQEFSSLDKVNNIIKG